jgi:hypothetical protein
MVEGKRALGRKYGRVNNAKLERVFQIAGQRLETFVIR